jgi:hypothetical protein
MRQALGEIVHPMLPRASITCSCSNSSLNVIPKFLSLHFTLFSYQISIHEKGVEPEVAHKNYPDRPQFFQYAPRLLQASTKSGISSAVLLTASHLITPVSSVAQLPPICHRFPLGSTSRPHNPSCVPNFLAAICVHGFSK